MSVPKIFESEYRFCLILWENEPVKSGRLVELCREKLGWSKATTYTVIKRLSQRGVLKNEDGGHQPGEQGGGPGRGAGRTGGPGL